MDLRLVAGWLWALPTTLLGLVLAVLGGARPYSWRPAGVWQWVGVWGFWGWWYRPGSQWGAITFGQVTIFNPANKDDPVMLRHERTHTIQTWALGPFFLPVYLAMWLFVRGKYIAIPLEIAAYSAQKKPDRWG